MLAVCKHQDKHQDSCDTNTGRSLNRTAAKCALEALRTEDRNPHSIRVSTS